MKKGKLIFVVNAPQFFVSHRLPLAVAAREAGYEVHVATAVGDDVAKIESMGFKHHSVSFARSGQNPFYEIITFLRLFRLFVLLKPDLIHAVTIKPVLYGGIAARLAGVKSVVAAVSGLGTVFIATSTSARLRRWIVKKLYSAALLNDRAVVIFQNSDDSNSLLKLGVLKQPQVRIIRGSGVCLNNYPFLPEPDGKPVVVMAARLLRDKGVFEFVEAARLLASRGVDVEMRLIGSPDMGNPTSISQDKLDQWARDGFVRLLGYRADIAQQYASSHIVCLPSYREGLPKSLVEAAACGRAVVTTDVPGCRDAIKPGVTGLLVPVQDSVALADAIQKLLGDSNLRNRMGLAGRQLAIECYNIVDIVEQHINIYEELMANG